MNTPGFIKLQTADGRKPIYLAVDQIASFVAYDQYRPNYIAWVATKDGNRYQVVENTDDIAAMIAAAT